MKKVSIAFYSTFKTPGWKSEQLEALVPRLREENLFSKGYGIRNFKKLSDKDLILSPIPLIVAKAVNKISKLPYLKDYYGYLTGEAVTGCIFKKQIAEDDSEVVYVKPRPLSIVKKCKEVGKYIVLEFGEMHPNDTYSALKTEYRKYGCNSEYIFTSRYAINEARKAIELADIIVVLSEESKRSFVRNGVDERKIKVINLGLNQRYKNTFSNDKEFAFVSTAKHSFVKGTHELLMAWKSANINNMTLYIVGELSEDIKLFVSEHGPFNNVTFTGKKKIEDFYRDYNFIGILNSLSEGYGRAVIEYMGHGFPVITTPVATCDIVVHEKNGLIINDTNELTQALQFFSNNISLYKKFGSEAREAAEETLDYSYTDEMLKLIKGI